MGNSINNLNKNANIAIITKHPVYIYAILYTLKSNLL